MVPKAAPTAAPPAVAAPANAPPITTPPAPHVNTVATVAAAKTATTDIAFNNLTIIII